MLGQPALGPAKLRCSPPGETAVELNVVYPNYPAAVCLSNRAAVHLKQKQYKKALRDATKACALCPEYVKGHARQVAALKGLGQVAQAAEVEEEIADYNTGLRFLPWYGAALLTAGWLDHESHTAVYTKAHSDWVISRVTAGGNDDRSKFVHAKASLVPFQGGQWLMIGVNFMEDWKKQEVPLRGLVGRG